MTMPQGSPDRGLERPPLWFPARSARLAYEYFVFCFGYLYFGAGCALVSLVSMVLHPLLPARFGVPLGRWMTGVHFRGFLALLRASGLVRIDLAALDRLCGEHSIIIAPNHPCLLDAVFVLSRLPQAACIMKAAIWDNLFLGGGARLSGHIRNDAPINLVRLSTRELRAGNQLLVFPEGTRTRAAPVNAFKGGFALMAKKSGAAVQTIFIETNSAFLCKGWPLLKKPDFPLFYRARLGMRFSGESDVKAFVLKLENYYRRALSTPIPVEPTTARESRRAATSRSL
ncbi:MAG TPA: lysophospholipid acyltransferase family protein [Burkholderiales bacterium]|jgi:1-acyl-sn-glycerol-3-phosphate acyltransferase|nr:lysophospholipid acyltransferase family protein [Burkholderiales bacterium]